jgi:glycosyltransferase involved in cell wall biosynthesis
MQDKLRIGVVITESYSPESGGAFSYYAALLNAIDRHVFNPLLEFVFVRWGEGETLAFDKEFLQIDQGTFKSDKARSKKTLSNISKIPFSFVREQLKTRYETYITGSLKMKKKNNVEAWLKHHRVDLLYHLTPTTEDLNFPFVVTHWDIAHYSTWALPEISMNGVFEERELLYSSCYNKAFAIFCESETGKKELLRFKQIHEDKVFVVPIFPGQIIDLQIEKDEQLTRLRDEFSLQPHSYYLYPAQFWAHKNHYHLLLAFSKVLSVHPHLKLVLCGSDKGNLAYLEKVIAQLQLQDSVLIPGFVPNETLYSLYKNAIALVMPTLLGPTNMPLLEAAFMGCPVITSASDGHKELLGDFGTYVDPLDEDAIANAMLAKKAAAPQPEPVFQNNTNTIEAAIQKIEAHFLVIRKTRKLFGDNFEQY